MYPIGGHCLTGSHPHVLRGISPESRRKPASDTSTGLNVEHDFMHGESMEKALAPAHALLEEHAHRKQLTNI